MPRLELRVESGENAHNSIDTQNGNMCFLQKIHGLPFYNNNNDTIDERHIQGIPDIDSNGAQLNYFMNNNNTTTPVVHVDITDDLLNNIITQLNEFKGTLEDEFEEISHIVNVSRIVGESTLDNRELNPASLLKAIESIWLNFKSDRIYQDIHHDRVNSNQENQPDSHHYVNAAYDGYMQHYRQSGGPLSNNQLHYIHPLLFPKIFQLVFPDNEIPRSTFQNTIAANNYNQSITAHNVGYIEDRNTTLYIYKNPAQIPIDGVRTIQRNLRNQQDRLTDIVDLLNDIVDLFNGSQTNSRASAF